MATHLTSKLFRAFCSHEEQYHGTGGCSLPWTIGSHRDRNQIDVIMIDLIAAKNPVLASGSLQGELGYALQAINVVLSAPIPRYYALTRSADTQAISQNIKHTLW